MSGLCLEYAKSGRSKCKACKATLPEGSLRIGHSRDMGDFSQTAWFHLPCLPTSDMFRSISAGTIPGFKELKKKDQTTVRKQVAELCEEAEEKLSDSSRPAKRGKSKGRKKKVEAGWKGYTKKQLEEFKEMKGKLEGMGMEELKSLCRKNDQKVTGKKGELVERVADGRILGRIPKCSSCGGGHLRFNPKTGSYTCPGYMEDSDFIHCNKLFSVTEISRLPWQD